MNQISQYFGKNPKKKDLSDGSKTGDDYSNKPPEGSSGSYTEEVDVFEESVALLEEFRTKNKSSLHAS